MHIWRYRNSYAAFPLTRPLYTLLSLYLSLSGLSLSSRLFSSLISNWRIWMVGLQVFFFSFFSFVKDLCWHLSPWLDDKQIPSPSPPPPPPWPILPISGSCSEEGGGRGGTREKWGLENCRVPDFEYLMYVLARVSLWGAAWAGWLSSLMHLSGPSRVIKFLYSPAPPPPTVWALKAPLWASCA